MSEEENDNDNSKSKDYSNNASDDAMNTTIQIENGYLKLECDINTLNDSIELKNKWMWSLRS